MKRNKNIADNIVTIYKRGRHAVQVSNPDLRVSGSNVLLYSKHEYVVSSLLPLDSSARLLIVQNNAFCPCKILYERLVLPVKFLLSFPCYVYMLLLESSMRFIS